MKARFRAVLPALVLTGVAQIGCARALREPPPLTDPAGGGGATARPERVPPLLLRANLLYAARNLTEVREAGKVWLEAARADTTRVEGLEGAARAYVWLTEHETDAPARQSAATLAVNAAQWCERIKPGSASCVYWLGAALGVQAREKQSTALDALPRIEDAFKRAATADPMIEYAGPDRALALLYLRAPGWPTGPGDPDLGLQHARKAVELAPDYPPNDLALGEALAATGDMQGARGAYERALEKARRLADDGEPDAGEWIRQAGDALAGISNH